MKTIDLAIQNLMGKIKCTNEDINLFLNDKYLMDDFFDIVTYLTQRGIDTDELRVLYEKTARLYHQALTLKIDDFGEILVKLTNTRWINYRETNIFMTYLSIICCHDKQTIEGSAIMTNSEVELQYHMNECDLSVYDDGLLAKIFREIHAFLRKCIFCVGDYYFQDNEQRVHIVDTFRYEKKVYPTYIRKD